MRQFCSVHTHSTLCDGKDTLAEMVRAAFEAGAVSFGASGHSHTPIPEDEGGVLPADMTAYRAEVLRLSSWARDPIIDSRSSASGSRELMPSFMNTTPTPSAFSSLV